MMMMMMKLHIWTSAAALLSAMIALSTVDGKSLTLVIDTTGSMGNDIAAVKLQAASITSAAASNPDFANFVFVPFNDPCEYQLVYESRYLYIFVYNFRYLYFLIIGYM